MGNKCGNHPRWKWSCRQRRYIISCMFNGIGGFVTLFLANSIRHYIYMMLMFLTAFLFARRRLHRQLLSWTPKRSIFKLIIIFCLPQMKASWKICKLLALSTMVVV